MKGFIQDLLIFALAVCCFIVGCQFEKKTHEPCPEVQYIKGKDSLIYVYVTSDTTVSNPKPSRTYAPQLTNIDKSDSANWTNNVQNPCDDSIRVYVTNKVDSSGSIQVTDSVQGKLLSTRITSQMLYTTVFRTDTLLKTVTIEKTKALFGPYGAINIGEKTSLTTGLLYSKGRTGYMAGYNLQNKYIQVGAFLNLRK